MTKVSVSSGIVDRRYEPELVSRPRAFQLGLYFSYSLSQGVVLDAIETEVCRRGINKCRARSTSGERSTRRRVSPEPPLEPPRVERKAARLNASARFSFQVRFIRFSIANSTGRFLASSLSAGRTRPTRRRRTNRIDRNRRQSDLGDGVPSSWNLCACVLP